MKLTPRLCFWRFRSCSKVSSTAQECVELSRWPRKRESLHYGFHMCWLALRWMRCSSTACSCRWYGITFIYSRLRAQRRETTKWQSGIFGVNFVGMGVFLSELCRCCCIAVFAWCVGCGWGVLDLYKLQELRMCGTVFGSDVCVGGVFCANLRILGVRLFVFYDVELRYFPASRLYFLVCCKRILVAVSAYCFVHFDQHVVAHAVMRETVPEIACLSETYNWIELRWMIVASCYRAHWISHEMQNSASH